MPLLGKKLILCTFLSPLLVGKSVSSISMKTGPLPLVEGQFFLCSFVVNVIVFFAIFTYFYLLFCVLFNAVFLPLILF